MGGGEGERGKEGGMQGTIVIIISLLLRLLAYREASST